jgi:hypothetical protein
MSELPDGWEESAEHLEIRPGPRLRGYAIGEFLCRGCGGLAVVIVTEVPAEDWTARAGSSSVTWWAPWNAYVRVELVCQGPADPYAPDEAWNHAGETIDMLATGYQCPISLN